MLYRTILLRDPLPEEVTRCKTYLKQVNEPNTPPLNESELFTEMVQALLISNEFQFAD